MQEYVNYDNKQAMNSNLLKIVGRGGIKTGKTVNQFYKRKMLP
jgi:hypothetical protein